MSGQNVGDLLNKASVTWGSFMGGFDLTKVNSNGTTGCLRSSTGLAGTINDYIPHHSFFGYWATTGNPNGPPNAGRLPQWPLYDAGSDAYLELGPQVVARSALRRSVYDSLDAMGRTRGEVRP